MNTTELSALVSKKMDTTKSTGRRVVRTILEAIASSVQAGNKVNLTGFGTFSRHERSARVGRNPQTGETVKIPAKKIPKFRPGKLFREATAGKAGVSKAKVSKAAPSRTPKARKRK